MKTKETQSVCKDKLIRVHFTSDQYKAYKKAVKKSGMKAYSFNTLALINFMSSSPVTSSAENGSSSGLAGGEA